MSQRFALRTSKQVQDQVFDKVKKEGIVDRYYGSDYYVQMYGALELSAYAVKHPNPNIGRDPIEKPPKGAEFMKDKKITGLRRYPTEYKQAYLEPESHDKTNSYAGKPLKYTPIGSL